MKKNYSSPEIKLVKVNTENVMAVLSNVETGSPDRPVSGGPDGTITPWRPGDGQPETAKDNNSSNLWDNED